MVASAPPGWYDDGRGAARWWDGRSWTAATSPAGPSLVDIDPRPRVADATPVYTRWIWWIVALPFLVVVPMIAYLVDLQARMTAMYGQLWTIVSTGGRPDPEVVTRFMVDQLGLVFDPWYLVLALVGWTTSGIAIWFSYLDRRDLMSFGYARPFHWGWSFLAPIVYVIGRTIVVRRQSGRGAAPMWVLIALQGMVVVIAGVWSFVFSMSMVEVVMTQIGSIRG